MLYVFKNCKAFIRTIPILQYDKQKCEDLDTEGEDHVADEVRYFCMSRPIRPSAAIGRKVSPVTMLDIGAEERITAAKRPGMEIINEEENTHHRDGADPSGARDPEPIPPG